MFQDIQGFTGLAETMDPVRLAKLTSECIKKKKKNQERERKREQITSHCCFDRKIDMDTMTEIVVKNGGTIDKYIGDCIMSLFGAPEVACFLPHFFLTYHSFG